MHPRALSAAGAAQQSYVPVATMWDEIKKKYYKTQSLPFKGLLIYSTRRYTYTRIHTHTQSHTYISSLPIIGYTLSNLLLTTILSTRSYYLYLTIFSDAEAESQRMKWDSWIPWVAVSEQVPSQRLLDPKSVVFVLHSAPSWTNSTLVLIQKALTLLPEQIRHVHRRQWWTGQDRKSSTGKTTQRGEKGLTKPFLRQEL